MYKKSKQIFVLKSDKPETDKYKKSAKAKKTKDKNKDCNC